MDYYFEATDLSGNAISKGSSSSPLAVSVVAAILPQVDAPKEEPVILDIPSAGKPFALTTKAVLKKPWYKKWWVWTIVAVAGAAASGGGGSGGGDNADGNTTITVTGPAPP